MHVRRWYRCTCVAGLRSVNASSNATAGASRRSGSATRGVGCSAAGDRQSEITRGERGMPDHSFLDDKYFIDSHVYNCPFCNRRNVLYQIVERHQFNWAEDKICYVFIANCTSCGNRSMHLSYNDIAIEHLYTTDYGKSVHRFSSEYKDIDSLFFYSVPTSFFSLDGRIPNILRELLTEAEGSLNGNFLTGCSAPGSLDTSLSHAAGLIEIAACHA